MHLSRRSLLALGASVVLAACSDSDRNAQTTATTEYDPLPRPALSGAEPYSGAFPFTLGVAAGDPDPHRVVLWTRLAPDPLQSDGGMDDRSYVVTWEIALDEEFSEATFVGATVAEARFAHSVHVDVTELEPAVSFWYRFRAGPHVSAVGRMAAMPLFTMPDTVTVAAVSGGSPATHGPLYDDVASAAPDLVLFSGDYTGGGRSDTLADYRSGYAQALLNRELQAARAAAPWLVAHDARQITTDAARQAWWEHSPVRLPPPSPGEVLITYRHCVVGSLVDLIIVDPRVEGSGRVRLGKEQERWLSREAADTTVIWHAVAGSGDMKVRERARKLLTSRGAENPIDLDPVAASAAVATWHRHVFTPETWTTTRRSVDPASGVVAVTDEATMQARPSAPST